MLSPPPSPDEEVKDLPRARTLGLVMLAGYIVFVLTYLLIWETHPNWQLILNRISWSSSDFIGLAAAALALYSYSLFERYSKNKDVIYLQKFVLVLKHEGIEPSDIAPLIASLKGVMAPIKDDPEFQARLQKATARVTAEQFERLKRLDEDELYELLRSGGGKLL
jgi:hypothetical protein